MQINNIPKPGTLLISKPLIGDGFFEQSVVYLTEHNDDGSLGFTLNKESLLQAQDLIDDLNGLDQIYYGGPVEQDALFFLHNIDVLKGAKPAQNGLYLGGDFELFQDALRLDRRESLEQIKVKFFLGYSGWSPGQLEDEIAQDTWIVVEPSPDENPLDMSTETWRHFMKRLGGDYALWANAPEDPFLN
jgi:putative transcriptional regulator